MTITPSFDPHGTTILGVRRNGAVALGGDGQVTLGNTVMKGNARKVRRLGRDGQVLAGFAGAAADAFTLFQALRGQAREVRHNLTRRHRAGQDWRSSRYLRRLEALLLVGDPAKLFIISGNGDVLEPTTTWRPSARAASTRWPLRRR